MAKAMKKNADQALSTAINYEADAGAGLEGADKDSFAIPFVAVLQGLSPAVETVEGAKPGLLLNTITNELYTEAQVVPVAFSRRFLRWVDRKLGGGFKGDMMPSEVEEMIASGAAYYDEDNKLRVRDSGNTPDDMLKDTRQHYVLVYSPATDTWSPAIIALASTGIKRSKRFMAQIGNFKMRTPDGRLFTPPSYARIYSVTTEKESNDAGTWYSPVFNPVKNVEDPELYSLAKEFYSQINAGEITVDHNTMEEPAEESSGF